jgi:hypothetical protein
MTTPTRDRSRHERHRLGELDGLVLAAPDNHGTPDPDTDDDEVDD